MVDGNNVAFRGEGLQRGRVGVVDSGDLRRRGVGFEASQEACSTRGARDTNLEFRHHYSFLVALPPTAGALQDASTLLLCGDQG